MKSAPVAKKTGKPTAKTTAPAASIAAFLDTLDHPLKPVLEDVLAVIRGADVAASEGIKWNAPSFAGPDQQYFATLNVHTRGKGSPVVLLVLHRDAKAVAGHVNVADSENLLEWLGADRAVVRFNTRDEVRAKGVVLQNILRQWVGQLKG
ncbi:MAG: DUF1801 domain-containing protein [Gemmatimonadaceae bacterium]|nr:DUF1801 domain-containing protein [Gemmatimonadaceae bacterium]